MSWDLYNILCNYGDVLPTNIDCNSNKLIEELKPFEDKWKKFNPNKPHVPRDGLSVTSLDGGFDGSDLDSLKDLWEKTGDVYTESSFDVLTPVYDKSEELQRLVDPWKPWLARCHFIRFPPGGYFPTHCDGDRINPPEVFRIIVPIKYVNPPKFFFMIGGGATMQPIYWQAGKSYFLNTHKPHCLFNTAIEEHSLWLILNVKVCEESILKAKFAVYT